MSVSSKLKTWVTWLLGYLAGFAASVKILKAREKKAQERAEKASAKRKESVFAKWNRRRRERGLPEREPIKLVSKARGDSPPDIK